MTRSTALALLLLLLYFCLGFTDARADNAKPATFWQLDLCDTSSDAGELPDCETYITKWRLGPFATEGLCEAAGRNAERYVEVGRLPSQAVGRPGWACEPLKETKE